jgi:DNA helicase MCM9
MAEYLVDCNPKAIPPDQYKCLFGRFLEEYELLQVQKLLSLDGGCDEHYSVEIQSQDLTHFDSALSYSVLHYPKLLIPLFEEALLELQKEIMKQLSGDQLCRVKVQCHIRILSLPSIPEFSKRTISDVKAHETNAFVQVTGTVVRTGGVRMLEQSKQYECQNAKCRFRFTVCADPEQENMLPQPRCCPAKATTAGSSYESKCNSSNVRELEGGSVCVDYQEIKIQDHLERLSLGSVPRSIVVILLCDLVDRFNPGDDVVVVGTVLRQWRPVSRGARCVVDVAVEACSITVLGGRESIHNASQTSVAQFAHFWASRLGDSNSIFQARNDIVRAVCPQLFGMFYVKLSLLLALIGGNSTVYEGGVRRRSQSHMLIVGDPGCGYVCELLLICISMTFCLFGIHRKSQLLRFAASVVPRSVLTTGIGTTGAGLTCTAVREGNDWCLEAGALVLSNDGVCCIDEFASIREADRATIHEAMEQQTVSVAKAGLVVKLNTRATVIACCNPKGAYDVSADLSANTAIASPLLSRFDLILVLMDTASKDWDTQVSTFLLLQAVAGGVKSSADQSVDQDSPSLSSEIWSLETLRQYVTCVKACVHPEMTAEARCLLMRYYQLQRQSDERSSTRTTVRLLESLLRLSEAHAKLMFRNRVTSIDAIVAIHCVSLANPQESSMLGEIISLCCTRGFLLLFKIRSHRSKTAFQIIPQISLHTSNVM